MFPTSYFASRYYPPRLFPVGGEPALEVGDEERGDIYYRTTQKPLHYRVSEKPLHYRVSEKPLHYRTTR